MNEVKVHAELLALRQLSAFLLAREMQRSNSELEDIHEDMIADVIDVLSTPALAGAQKSKELEAAMTAYLDRLFSMASRIWLSSQH